jgi:hypothetical protein
MDTARGSIRQRGTNSYELRVYGGTDPSSGKRRWLTRTVRADRSDALRGLKALVAHANIAPAVGAYTTVAALLDQWFAQGRSTWSPTTIRNLTSIIERHLKPGLGHILWATSQRPSSTGSMKISARLVESMESLWRLARCDVSTLPFTLRSARHSGGPGYSRTSPTMQLRPEMNRPTCGHPRQDRWHSLSSSWLATRLFTSI